MPGEVALGRRDRARRRRAVGRRRRPGHPLARASVGARRSTRCGRGRRRRPPRARWCARRGRRSCASPASGRARCTVGGRKVVGISQRRTRGWARFQCAAYRRWDPAALVALLGRRPAPRSDDLAGDRSLELDVARRRPARRALAAALPDRTALAADRFRRGARSPPALDARAMRPAEPSPAGALGRAVGRSGEGGLEGRWCSTGGGRWGRVGREEGVRWGEMVDSGGKWGLRWGPVGIGGRAVGAAGTPRTPRQAAARQRQGTIRVFVGKYERQLDPKGRLALPSDFRPRFEPRCYLAYGQDGCIEVMTPEAFEDMANDLMERQKRGELTSASCARRPAMPSPSPSTPRAASPSTATCASFAGLEPGSPVVVSGAFDRVEVWHPEALRRIEHRRRPGPQGLGLTRLRSPTDRRPRSDPTNQQRGGRGTNRERRTRTCSAHPQSPGRQDGQPQLRPLPSRSSGRHPGGNRRPGGCR